VIVGLLPSLLSVSCGHLILSGILETQVEDVKVALQQSGVSMLTEMMKDGEWVALVV
jgi:ribosomal protein L11 methylase PrmA